MEIKYFDKMICVHGKNHTINRLDVKISHLKKTMTTTNKDTASVVDDVIVMLECIKSEIQTN